jgi:hypothetical protein
MPLIRIQHIISDKTEARISSSCSNRQSKYAWIFMLIKGGFIYLALFYEWVISVASSRFNSNIVATAIASIVNLKAYRIH